mgnify:FL=1
MCRAKQADYLRYYHRARPIVFNSGSLLSLLIVVDFTSVPSGGIPGKERETKMAARERVAARILPKTGLVSVDTEAIVLQSCLSRIDDHRDLDKRQRVTKVTRVAAGAVEGTTVDISGRTNMGAALVLEGGQADDDIDSLEADRDAVAQRSDVVVAQSALLRLMRTSAEALKGHEQINAQLQEARAMLKFQHGRIVSLEADNARLTSQVVSLHDPQSCFERYLTVVEEQSAAHVARLTAAAGSRRKLLGHLADKTKYAALVERSVKKLAGSVEQQAHTQSSLFTRADEEQLRRTCRMFAAGDDAPPSAFVPARIGDHHAPRGGDGDDHDEELDLDPDHVAAERAMREAYVPFINAMLSAPTPASVRGGGRRSKPTSSAVADLQLAAISSPVHSRRALLTMPPAALHSVTAAAANDSGDDAADDGPLELTMTSLDRVMAEALSLAADDEASDDFASGELALQFDDVMSPTAAASSASALLLGVAADAVEPPQGGGGGGTGAAPSGTEDRNDDELVVTRVRRPNGLIERIVTRTDVDSTALGVILSVLRLAPANYVVVNVDREALVGRQDRLMRYAANAGVAKLWIAVCNATQPAVFITDREWQPQTTSPVTTPASSSVRLRPPGIVASLRTGVAGQVVDPIAQQFIRCYASTMLASCRVDALVEPYYDMHQPFFSTQGDLPKQWVQVVFNDTVVMPSGYAIASTHPTLQGGYFPRSWTFEASADGGVTWVRLSDHRNDTALHHESTVAYFGLATTATPHQQQFYSQFRLTQTGLNSHGTHHFNVSSLELYGRAMYIREGQVVDAERLPRIPFRRSGFVPFDELPRPAVTSGGTPAKKGSKKKSSE